MSTVTTEIQIRLFGGFRQFRTEPRVAVSLDEDARIGDLRRAVEAEFADNANACMLLKASAFATDERVLDEDELVPAGRELSLLPPVCGG